MSTVALTPGQETGEHPSWARAFTKMSSGVARWTGKPAAFLGSCLVILIWAATGPLFRYSDTWQLVINTGTTIVTFLMVFLIQNTQNRDGAAIQAKLDELIRASAAQNRYIGIEALTEEELEELKQRCAARAKSDGPEPDAIVEAANRAQEAAGRKAARAAAQAVEH